MTALIVVLAVVAFVLTVITRSVRIVPQANAQVLERLGRYQRTLEPGLALVVPFVDRLRSKIDLREQVVTFPRSRSSPGTTSSSASTRSSTSRSPTPARRRTRSRTTSRP